MKSSLAAIELKRYYEFALRKYRNSEGRVDRIVGAFGGIPYYMLIFSDGSVTVYEYDLWGENYRESCFGSKPDHPDVHLHLKEMKYFCKELGICPYYSKWL